MNSLQLLTKIKSRLEDLNHAAEQVLSNNNDLSALDKDLLKQRCVELYELLIKLKTKADISAEDMEVLENIEMDQKEISIMEIISQTENEEISLNSIAESFIENQVEPLPEIVDEFIAEVPQIELEAIEITEEIAEEKIEVVAMEINETAIEQTEFSDEKIDELIKETLHSKSENYQLNFKKEEKPAPFLSIAKTEVPVVETSLNERLNGNGFEISNKISEPKIDSLKTAISLNKKIAFVNELFRENVVEYAKAIDKLNSSNNLNEALVFWGDLKLLHNWDTNNNLVGELEKMIQQRFSHV